MPRKIGLNPNLMPLLSSSNKGAEFIALLRKFNKRSDCLYNYALSQGINSQSFFANKSENTDDGAMSPAAAAARPC